MLPAADQIRKRKTNFLFSTEKRHKNRLRSRRSAKERDPEPVLARLYNGTRSNRINLKATERTADRRFISLTITFNFTPRNNMGARGVLAHGKLLLHFTHYSWLFYAPQ